NGPKSENAMAARRRAASSSAAPPSGGEEHLIIAGLAEFAALVNDFAVAVDEQLALADQQERQAIAQILRDTLAVESSSISELFREVLASLPADGRKDVERFWSVSGATPTITAARRAIQNPALARRSVLEWIKLILELIK